MKMRPVPATVQGRVVMAPGWMMTMEPAMAMMMTMEPAMAMMLAMMTDPLPGVPVPAVRGSSQVMMHAAIGDCEDPFARAFHPCDPGEV